MAKHGFTFWMEKKLFFIKKKKEVFKYDKTKGWKREKNTMPHGMKTIFCKK